MLVFRSFEEITDPIRLWKTSRSVTDPDRAGAFPVDDTLVLTVWVKRQLAAEGVFLRLLVPHIGVFAAEGKQLGVGAALHDPSVLEEIDGIRHGGTGQTVGNKDHRLIAAGAEHIVIHFTFGNGVESRGGLVENGDAAVAREDTGNGDLLRLAA